MTETLHAREVGRANPPTIGRLPKFGRSESGSAKPATLLASVLRSIEERRMFILLPFSMVAGLMANATLTVDPPVPGLVLGGGAFLVTLFLTLRSPVLHRLTMLGGAFWVGLLLLPVHGALFGTSMLERPVYGTYRVLVDEVLSASADEQRIIVSRIEPIDGSPEVAIRRGRIVIREGAELSPGDVASGAFRFTPVPGPVHPGAFDTQFHSYFDGVGAYGTSTRPPVLVESGSGSSPARVVDAVRRGISGRIDAALAQPASGVSRAIINGDQSAVEDSARDVMAAAGIAHVLSVSGLHLTIVAGGTFWVIRLLLAAVEGIAIRLAVKQLAAMGGIASAVGYFLISGGNVAALRSTLMILLVFGAVLFGRRALTMRNVALAALAVIASDPASVFRPSFQLSFAAVVALVGAYENLRSERSVDAGLRRHLWAYAKGVVVTSLVAGAATLVFSIYHFQQTSPLGVLGNLLSLPLVGFVMMPAAVLSVGAMPLGIEVLPLAVMGWAVDRMLEMAGIVAALSSSLHASPLLTPMALVVGAFALAWFAFLRDRWRLLGPVIAVPLIALTCVDKPPDVLVADTTQAITVRGADGLAIAAGKPRSFALDVWRETYGDPIEAAAQQQCDSIACIGTSPAGFSYAIIHDPAGFAEECGSNDLVVTRLRAPSYCAAGTVVDGDDLAAGGVHWLRWDAASQQFEVRPSISGLGRAWRLKP